MSSGDGTSTSGAVPLASLVSRALELRDEGRADWLAAACDGHPHQLADVRDAVAHVDAMPSILGRSAEHDPAIGSALNERFVLLERIGSGAMGTVYLADDLRLGRKVACKLVHPGLMAPREAFERFEREAQATAAVQHPSVATIHDRGRTDAGQVYIVLELVDGPPLSVVLEAARARGGHARGDDAVWIRGDLGVEIAEASWIRTAVRWVADLAVGLEAVHRAGVLHRDVKPSNVLVRRDGRPVLIDFGIALLDDQVGQVTRTGTSVGTPAYMPPEALRHDVQRTPASDVYGLTATLYHLVTLHAPYEGTPTQILAALATRDPEPAATRRPGIPRDLQAVLDRGMHRDPARRYASAAEFEADLRAFLEFRPVAARAITPFERALRRLARSRAAQGALVALVLVALAFGASAWREHALDAGAADYREIVRGMPPNFTVVGVANREVRDDADRAEIFDMLDRADATASVPTTTRLLRASFRQDHGDAEGAARDMKELADDVRTPLARELAARYAAADGALRGVASIDLDGLPEPRSPLDRYLLGYHELRRERAPAALEILADPDVRRIDHAEELFLAFTSFDGLKIPAQRRLAGERYADVLRLETRIGGRTAATAHISARMLAILDRHADALDVAEEGVRLSPRAYVVRLNAGYCAFVLGRMARAREHLEAARASRPQYAHLVQILVWVDVSERRFDEALELVREAAPGLVPASPDWADAWSAWIAAYAALDADAAGDADQRALRLAQARASIARVADPERGTVRTAGRLVRALEDDDDDALITLLAEQLAGEPREWWRLRLLQRHLPDALGPGATAGVRRVLQALAPETYTEPSR